MLTLADICGGAGCTVGDGIAVLGIMLGIAAIAFAIAWADRKK